jgi:hypothetical protein
LWDVKKNRKKKIALLWSPTARADSEELFPLFSFFFFLQAELTAESTLGEFWATVQDDERLEGLEEKDKKLLHLYNLHMVSLRAAQVAS